MSMTVLERRPVLSPIAGKVRLVQYSAAVLLIIPAGTLLVQAESSPPGTRVAASGLHARKPRHTSTESGQATRPSAAKAKTRPRAAPKNARPSAVPAAKSRPAASAKAQAAPAAKPTQVMDFDADQVEGQRLEPGFELIQAAPRRACQPSLVTPLKPGDSVVKQE
jgi:hypothetical protein